MIQVKRLKNHYHWRGYNLTVTMSGYDTTNGKKYTFVEESGWSGEELEGSIVYSDNYFMAHLSGFDKFELLGGVW